MDFERHFYKCPNCLGVFAVEGPRVKIIINNYRSGPQCDCGSATIWMGRVERDRLIRKEDHCACDSRCTDATGPHCNCSCGGVNHGTHRTVQVLIDGGKVPFVHMPDVEERLRIARELKEAKEAAKARIEDRYATTLADMRAGRWVSDKGQWLAVRDEQRKLLKASQYLIHSKRMDALSKIAQQSNAS